MRKSGRGQSYKPPDTPYNFKSIALSKLKLKHYKDFISYKLGFIELNEHLKRLPK